MWNANVESIEILTDQITASSPYDSWLIRDVPVCCRGAFLVISVMIPPQIPLSLSTTHQFTTEPSPRCYWMLPEMQASLVQDLASPNRTYWRSRLRSVISLFRNFSRSNRHEIIRRRSYSKEMLTSSFKSKSFYCGAELRTMIQCGLEGASEALAGLYIDSVVLRCGLRSSSIWANGEAGMT